MGSPVDLATTRQEWKENPTDQKLFQLYVDAATQYFAAPDLQPDAHWFCDAKYSEDATAALISFSFVDGGDDAIEALKRDIKNGLVTQLGRCWNCTLKYHAVREDLEKILGGLRLDSGNINSFLQILNTEDVQRISDVLSKDSSGPPIALGEALVMANWMENKPLKKTIVEQAKARLVDLIELMESNFLPGAVYFLFSEDPTVQSAFAQFMARSQLSWTLAHTRMLMSTLREKLDLVTTVDYAWYITSEIIDHVKLDSNVLDKITEYMATRSGSPPGPGFYLCMTRIMTAQLRMPDPKILAHFLEKVDLGKAADVAPSSTPASAAADSTYSQLSKTCFFEWLDCLKNRMIAVTDSKSHQAAMSHLLASVLQGDFDHPELVRISLEILSAGLKLDFEARIPVTSAVDIALRMPLFQLTTQRGNDVARLIRAGAMSESEQTVETPVTRAANSALRWMIEFTVFGLLSNTPEFKPSADINRSYEYAWEVTLSDRNLLQSRPLLVRAVISASAFVPYLDPTGKTARTFTAFYETIGMVYTRDDLMYIVKDVSVEMSLLMVCVGMDSGLSELARDVFSRVYSSEENSFKGALIKFFEQKPASAVAIVVKLGEVALGFGEFTVLPALVKLLKGVFDALYDPIDGVIDEVSDKLSVASNPILQLWNVTWQLMTLSFGSLRSWSKQLKSVLHLLKHYISDSLDLCLALLGYFQRIEATMPSSADGQNYGSCLIKEVVITLESMVPLLKLRDTNQLDSSFRIYKGLIELLHKYHVKTPASLCQYFENLAKSMTLLKSEQYAELLASTGEFSDEQMAKLILTLEQSVKKTSPSPSSGETTPKPPPSATHTQPVVRQPTQASMPFRTEVPAFGHSGASDAGKQSSMLNFFTKVTRMPAQPPQSRLTAHGVTPSAPTQLSMMEKVRMQLAAQQSATPQVMRKAAAAPVPADIHPARPAGFNPRRQNEKPSSAAPKHSVPNPNQAYGEENDEDDEDEEEEDGVLITLGRRPRNIENSARIAPGLATRSARAPNPSDAEQELRRMRARLAVEPTELHKRILSWDYFLQSPYPSGFVNNRTPVPSQFKDVTEYKRVMEPLLHLEAWQGIQRARAESESKAVDLIVGKRVNCDEFIDVYGTVDVTQMSDAGIGEADLVLIAFPIDKSDNESRKKLRSISASMLHCLALVKEGTLSTRRNRSTVDLQLRTFHPGELGHYFASGRTLYMQRVCSITTVEREYTALMALQYYDLKDAVLQGQVNSPMTTSSNPRISELAKVQGLNSSQAQAVENALSRPGFNLIQGPPGTGKTKTILGIAGAFFGANSNVIAGATKRLLICAPSNAAIDEIALRLKTGIATAVGDSFVPKVVRLGRKDAVHPEVRDLTLEALVAKSVSAKASVPDAGLRQKMDKLLAQRRELEGQLTNRGEEVDSDGLMGLQSQLQGLSRQIRELSALLDLQREQLKSDRIRREAEYKKVQSDYLANAHIICSTLSGSAFGMLASLQLTFPTVVIDEAAQCVELSALIPLKYGCKQCIMVGDPHQLPPTVLSQEAARLRYEQSMFVRFYEREPTALTLLDTQFRMHPQIAAFPASEFYKGKLKNGPGLEQKTAREWHVNPVLSPFRFLEVSRGRQERSGNMSWMNRAEAEVVSDMLKLLFKQFPKVDFTNKIGVVSPYKSQVNLIKRLLRDTHGPNIENFVDVSSVDGFQGQEKDIIIMSCVRAEIDSDGIGFLADIRRMNVAITRARSSLWIVGNRESLEKNPRWRRLIAYARYIGMFSTYKRNERDSMRALTQPPYKALEESEPWLSAYADIASENAELYDLQQLRSNGPASKGQEASKSSNQETSTGERLSQRPPKRQFTELEQEPIMEQLSDTTRTSIPHQKQAEGRKVSPPAGSQAESEKGARDTSDYRNRHRQDDHDYRREKTRGHGSDKRPDRRGRNDAPRRDFDSNDHDSNQRPRSKHMKAQDPRAYQDSRSRPYENHNGPPSENGPSRSHHRSSAGRSAPSSSSNVNGPLPSRSSDPGEHPKNLSRASNSSDEPPKKTLKHSDSAKHPGFDPTARAGHQGKRKASLFIPAKRPLPTRRPGNLPGN